MRRTALLLASTTLAVLLANSVLLFGVDEQAEAAFPGENGKIAFISAREGGRAQIYSMDPNGSNQTNLTPDSGSGFDPSWSADGTKIAFTSQLDGDDDIHVMNADGSDQTNLTKEPEGSATSYQADPTWSRDSTKIAYTGYTNGNNYDIYTMNADGSKQTNLTYQPNVTYPNGIDFDQTWSPDGEKIAFISNRDGPYDIYTMNTDGTDVKRLTNTETTEQNPTWSPDGTKIAFVIGPYGNEEIYTMDADGTNRLQLTHNQAHDDEPAWSPDGTKLAFETNRDNRAQIYVMNADGSNATNISNNQTNDHQPDWQPANPPPPPPDTTPPDTTIGSGPSSLVNSRSASFAFDASEWRSTFECRLDGALFEACTSPKEYATLSNGAHTLEVRAIDAAGNTDATPATRAWSVDATIPVAKPPAQSLIAGSTLGTPMVPSTFAWSATDGGTGVVAYQLQRSVNGGAYADVPLPTALTTTTNPYLEPSKTYRYQVRAQDKAGNQSAWAVGPSFTVDVRQENHQAVAYTGTWLLQAASTASGGYVKYASSSGAKAKFTFAGRNVAWVAPKGSDRGKAEVWIDGVKATTIDLYSPSAQPRKMVFTKSWASSGNHTLEIRATGTKNASSSGKRIDVDAFVALR